MSDVTDKIVELIRRREIRVSEHASLELEKDDLFLDDLLRTAENSEKVEEYPDHGRGECVLLLHQVPVIGAVHAVWGVPKGYDTPAVLVTAYLPDPARWDSQFKRRVKP